MEKEKEFQYVKLGAHMSNEQTFLAYIRTGFTAFAVAAGLLKFFHDSFIRYVAAGCIIVGIVIIAIGWCRFYRIKNKITQETV